MNMLNNPDGEEDFNSELEEAVLLMGCHQSWGLGTH